MLAVRSHRTGRFLATLLALFLATSLVTFVAYADSDHHSDNDNDHHSDNDNDDDNPKFCKGLKGEAREICHEACDEKRCHQRDLPGCPKYRERFRKETGTSVLPCDKRPTATPATPRPTPSESEHDRNERLCKPLRGEAHELCDEYCEDQLCYRIERPSCAKLRREFEEETGSAIFPCDVASPTPPRPTATVTPTGLGLTATRTVTPTAPTPTTTATPIGCEICPTTIELEPRPGDQRVLDVGWTGIVHDQPFVSDGKLTLNVACASTSRPCGVCDVSGPVGNANAADYAAMTGGDINDRRCTNDTSVTCTANADCPGGTCEFFFGTTLPLSGGGVPVCLVNQISGPVTGTINVETGALASALHLTTRVFSGIEQAHPCPRCLGDAVPNDGKRGGTCDGGPRSGAPCDVNGSSGNAAFGDTSLDCPPAPGAQLAALPIDLSNTTGTATKVLSADSPNCIAFGLPAGTKCFCNTCANAAATPCSGNADCPAGIVCGGASLPTVPNGCDDLTCDAGGQCSAGPLDLFCGPTATFIGCLADQDCSESITGLPNQTCSVIKTRPCFTDNGVVGGSVTATGSAGVPVNGEADATLASLFCVSPTAGAAVNQAAGLPGLGRLELPVHISEGCAPPEVACGSATAPQCDGLCPDPDDVCGQSLFTGGCICGNPFGRACGMLVGAPQCIGVCPAEAPFCVDNAGTCQCSVSPGPPTCASGKQEVALTSEAGSVLDLGWTGIGHGQSLLENTSLTTLLDCVGPSCTINGTSLVNQPAGPPLPLSAGGVAMCVLNTFREAVTGTYDCATGCSEQSVKLVSKVFLAQDIAQPCPICVGDPTPNDGQKGGTCQGGTATPDAACDAGGTSPEFGTTSNDCLPAGSSVGELAIDITPLTTGTITQVGSTDCVAGGVADNCFCPGQNRGNSCDSGTCTNGSCPEGPIDGFCSNQRFRACSADIDCEGTFPGAGTCESQPRSCFTDTITRTGQCGTQQSTLVGFFCTPATRAPAVNTTLGLPGPAAVELPVLSTGCLCQP